MILPDIHDICGQFQSGGLLSDMTNRRRNGDLEPDLKLSVDMPDCGRTRIRNQGLETVK